MNTKSSPAKKTTCTLFNEKEMYEMEKQIYLDHAATTPVRKEVVEIMLPYFTESFGNPSSVYKIARKNKEIVDESRIKIAQAIGASSEEVFFTSGGSEADNWAIKGVAWAEQEQRDAYHYNEY